MTQTPILTDHTAAQIGDYVEVAELVIAGARFYDLEEKSCCEVSTMVFECEPHAPGFQRTH